MNSRGVEVIGMLHQPPESVTGAMVATSHLAAADIFTTRRRDLVSVAGTGRISPGDAGAAMATRRRPRPEFSGCRRAGGDARVSQAPTRRSRPGRTTGNLVGTGRNSRRELTDAASYVVNLSANPPLTPAELADRLDQPVGNSMGRWVDVSPPARDDYTTPVRARDLVLRMVVAKIHGADGIFLADPFDPQRGVDDTGRQPGRVDFCLADNGQIALRRGVSGTTAAARR